MVLVVLVSPCCREYLPWALPSFSRMIGSRGRCLKKTGDVLCFLPCRCCRHRRFFPFWPPLLLFFPSSRVPFSELVQCIFIECIFDASIMASLTIFVQKTTSSAIERSGGGRQCRASIPFFSVVDDDDRNSRRVSLFSFSLLLFSYGAPLKLFVFSALDVLIICRERET